MTEKILQPKKKHHYVWGKYLSKWCESSNKVYYRTLNGKIGLDSVRGLAKEDYFYQFEKLTSEESNIIKAFLKPLPKGLQDIHLSFLKNIFEIFNMQSQYKWGGRYDEEAKSLFFATKCNIIEDLHAASEEKVIPILQALYDEELNVLESNKNISSFLAFLGLQLFRTKKIKNAVLKNHPHRTQLEESVASALKKAWWLMSYVFGANLGYSLYLSKNKDTHSLLINKTDFSFLTSDQPVINVYESTDSVCPAERLELYYPIAPRVAYFISEDGRFPPGKVSIAEGDVNALNIKLAKESNVHIFGDSELILRKYISYVRLR